MKKLILLCLIVLQSCNHGLYLKGKYPDTASSAIISMPLEKVWESLLNIIVEYGLPVKLIDKSGGIVVSDYKSLNDFSTFELKSGKLYDSTAFIVSERLSYDYPNQSRKYDIGASWNLRMAKLNDSTTLVKTILYSIKVSVTGLNGKSTGNFEKWILEELVNVDKK